MRVNVYTDRVKMLLNVRFYSAELYHLTYLISIVYLIKSGQVAAVIPEYDDFCFMTIKEGYFFGECDILFNNERHQHTVKAFSDCQLYVLNKQQFQDILQ